jgi:uncharacterized protein (UPF0333 family)
MAQISRPFQIALAVVVLFAGVWLFVLQGHSSSPSSAPSASASAPAASSSAPSTSSAAAHAATHAAASSAAKSSAPASATASSTHVYHGPAPGVEGLTRAIVKAHQAVAASGEAPTQPASPSSSATASKPAASASVPATKTSRPSIKASSPPTKASSPSVKTVSPAVKSPTTPKTSSSTGTPARQKAVEAELNAGIPVVVLFWNPQGAEDAVDHRAVLQLAHNDLAAHRRLSVQEATASQVAEYGSITRGVQIDATPTIVVISPHDQAIVLTGVQDAFTIEQAIEEALHPQSQS